MTWIVVRCHPQKQRFLRHVPTCPFNVHSRAKLFPCASGHIFYGVPSGRGQSCKSHGQWEGGSYLWKRFKSREKTGGIELHLKNGEREPICVEMMSPFPTVLARSAKTCSPLVQKHSLKQRLLSGGMAKKPLTLGLAQVAGARLHLLMPTPHRVERGPLGTVCHHSLSPAILWPGRGPLAAFNLMAQHP